MSNEDNTSINHEKLINRRTFLRTSLAAGFGIFAENRWQHAENAVVVTFHDVRPIHSSANFITIIQLSDLHLPTILSMHEMIAGKVNKLTPDIIAITGDAINHKPDIPMLEQFLGLLDKRAIKIAIMGNHEWYSEIGPDNMRNIYRRSNCEFLFNNSKTVTVSGRQIIFTGIDSLNEGSPDLQAALNGVRPSSNHILLAHCPKSRDISAEQLAQSEYQINLMLSGHTHGGQINIFGYAPILPNGSGHYVKGWYKEGHIPMYVSRGIGTSDLPIRIGSAPEIPVFKYFLS